MSGVEFAAGAMLGRYRMGRKVGRGGMGVVYEAIDTTLGRTVAIKILSPDLSEDETLRVRFLHEARACARLNHPNIVTVHELGEHDGLHYLVMEYVEGISLAKFLESNGAISPAHALTIARAVAAALAAAHKISLVHRDVKPQNIMIADDGTVKLLDFGLAKLFERHTRVTNAGAILGTPQYMAPEQALGQTIDCRSDLYALGVVLFEMLTGRCPSQGNSPLVVMRKVIDDPAPSVGDLNPDVPADLQHLVDVLLSKDPMSRPPSASVVSDELANCLAKLSAGDSLLSHTPTARMRAAPEPWRSPPHHGAANRVQSRFSANFPITYRESTNFVLGAALVTVLLIYLLILLRLKIPDMAAVFQNEPFEKSVVRATIGGGAVAMVVAYYFLLGRRTMWALVLALAASFLSLFLAHGPFTSPSWQAAFNKSDFPFVGAFIEGVRSLLWMLIAMRMFGVVFAEETSTLLSRHGGRNWWMARLLLVAMASITLLNTLNYHFNPMEAPTNLALLDPEWNVWRAAHPDAPLSTRDPTTFFHQFERPYWVYSPYSVVNFVCIHVPLFVIPFFSAIRDWEKTDTFGRNSFARMRAAQSPAEIRRIFGEFERVCSETAARYIELPSLTALLALYEFFIGSRTTAEQSGAMAYAALVIVASVGTIVFFIALLYEKGFRQLIHNMENETPDWVHSKNVFAFLRHLVTESVGGLLLLAVPCIGVIAAIMRVLLAGM